MILLPIHNEHGLPVPTAADGRPELLACIDEPAQAEVEAGALCRFSGWVLSMGDRPVTVRARYAGRSEEFSRNRERADVMAIWGQHYPAAHGHCGFQFRVDLREFEELVEVIIEFDDGRFTATSPAFSVRRRDVSAVRRADYKQVWNGVSGDVDAAKLAVAGYTDEDEFRRAAEATVKTLEGTVGIRPSDVVLEIGAGVGRVGALLAPRCGRWIGADVSENMLEHMRHRLRHLPNVETVALSGWDLAPIPSASVDVVYCTVVFMHLDEWDRFAYVREAFRVLRPGGRLYVDNVNLASDEGFRFFLHHAEDFHPLDRPPNISKCSTPDELRVYFERAGFSGITQQDQGLWIVTYGAKA